MKAETVPLGEQLIAQEADLERQFAGKTITAASLATATQAIGSRAATLRAAHLKYHLATAELLTPARIQHYAELRGYSGSPQTNHRHGDHKH